MTNKIMKTFAKMLFQFTEPGWPDSDFCSECHEHAGIDIDDDVEAKTIGVEDGKS